MGMENAQRALVREIIHYSNGGARNVAPCGEYMIEPRGAGIGLHECGGACDFTLSFDAFQQHVVEGRIAIRH